MEENNKSCFSCKHYISSIGEKGYCKLFNHETTLPEKPCLSFEKKEIKHEVEKVNTDINRTDKLHRNHTNTIAVSAIFASTVLVIVFFAFLINLCVSVCQVETLALSKKMITCVVSLLLVLLEVFILFNVGRRFMWIRIFEIILSVAVVVLLIINIDYAFEAYMNYIAHYIELIS